jgi:hypothetical protein
MLGLFSSPADLFLPGVVLASFLLGVIATRGVHVLRRRRRITRRLEQIRLMWP